MMLPRLVPLEAEMLPEVPAERNRWKSPLMVLLIARRPLPKLPPATRPSSGRIGGFDVDAVVCGLKNVAEVVSVSRPTATRPRLDKRMFPESVVFCPFK
jgi:hypothetical protein